MTTCEVADPWVDRISEAVTEVDKVLLNLPSSELMRVDEVHELLLDLRNTLTKEQS